MMSMVSYRNYSKSETEFTFRAPNQNYSVIDDKIQFHFNLDGYPQKLSRVELFGKFARTSFRDFDKHAEKSNFRRVCCNFSFCDDFRCTSVTNEKHKTAV